MSNLTRFDPLDDLFRGFFVRPVELGNNPAGGQPPAIRMDVKEDGDAYQVHAELPGVKKEDIHVTIDGKAVAKFNEGVLELKLPKRAATASKRLAID